jgi:hypothetical protein
MEALAPIRFFLLTHQMAVGVVEVNSIPEVQRKWEAAKMAALVVAVVAHK